MRNHPDDHGHDDSHSQARPAGKYVPVDVEAERGIIAALLSSPHVYDDIVTQLSAEDFGDPVSAEIYRAVASLEGQGRAVDQITVADELRRTKTLTKVGGTDRLARLVELAADYPNIDAYVDIVGGKAKLRQVIDAGRTMATAAIAPDADPPAVRELAESLVFDLGRERSAESLVGMPFAVSELMRELEQSRSNALLGWSTGFPELDKMTGGLQKGQLWILAARPAVGKSAWALQVAAHVAESVGMCVPFVSFEMTTGELTTRLLSQGTGLSSTRIRTGDLPAGGDKQLLACADKLTKSPLMIDDNPPRTIAALRSSMRRLARRTPIGAIVVDYLQLMESERRNNNANRNEEVSEISRGLKRLAVELGVPVLALSQLSRSLENRVGSKRPILSDLRDSGAIEQDANVVIALYREVLYNANYDPMLAEGIVLKNRGGSIGTYYMDFEAEAVRFTPTNRRPPALPPAGGNGNGGGGGWGGRGGNDPF